MVKARRRKDTLRVGPESKLNGSRTHLNALVGIDERLHLLKKKFNLTDQETASLIPAGGLNTETADKMSENVVSTASIPLAIIPDLIVNNHEYSVPIATEQRTILPMIKKGIEFTSQSGRKAVDLQVRHLETKVGSSLIVELYVDVKDSMGANIVDEMVETVSPFIAELASGRYNVRVLSNLATERLVRVEVSIDTDVFGRNEIVDDIVAASYFAEADPYRATTHNKGIMNGVSSVLLALGNDIRAVEAGAHAYAALSGQYRPLSIWRKDGGALVGELVMPMAVGIVGGAVSVHPTVRVALKILGVGSATELGEVAASVGLASNLGALHTLVTDGITSIQG
jgi:hydroxymethylglutaryl-CoA reductase